MKIGPKFNGWVILKLRSSVSIKTDKTNYCSGFTVCARYLDKHLAEFYQKKQSKAHIQ